MKRISVISLGLALLAAPVQGQLAFFPVDALPSGDARTFFGATYATGLNDASGKLDAYGAFVGRTGIGNRATVAGGLGMIDAADTQWTFGGAVGVDVLPAGGSAQVSIQSGVGYLSIDVGGGNSATTLHIPIGVALKGMIEGPTATVTPWVMPRLSIMRNSVGSFSDTSTEFGASGGFAVTLPSGFGVHTSLDLLASDPNNQWLLGVGLHYSVQ